MSPKMPQEHSDFRRQQILTAAWECFAEKGYQETTIRDIADRMSLSTGIIYSYFKGKDELLEAIHSCSMENKKRIADKIRQKETAREAINELFSLFLESCPFEELRKAMRADLRSWSEALKRENFRKLFISQYEYVRTIVAQFVEQGAEKGEFKAEFDPYAFVGFVNALLLGLEVQVALIDEAASRSYVDKIKNILLSNVWRDVMDGSGDGPLE